MPALARSRIVWSVLVLSVLTAATAAGQTGAAPATPLEVRAARAPRPPVIDGKLTDDGWAQVQPASGFTQRDPDEGKPATERTEVRFLYDNDSLYIGARLFDAEPGQIDRRLSRRDNSADAQVRRRPGSIGLGLYIAHEIVTAHRGTIDVKSSAESGTVFTVRLPRGATASD